MTDEEREMIRGWLIDYATLNDRPGNTYVLTYPQLVSKLWALVGRDPAPEVVLVEAPKGQTLEEMTDEYGRDESWAETILRTGKWSNPQNQ